MKDSIGVKNPYRYRGYRYDSETGLYYLNSRYYNAEWGRFINADGMIGELDDLLAHNLFLYCKNDPMNMRDLDGFLPTWNNIWGTGKKITKDIVEGVVEAAIRTSVILATINENGSYNFIEGNPQNIKK